MTLAEFAKRHGITIAEIEKLISANITKEKPTISSAISKKKASGLIKPKTNLAEPATKKAKTIQNGKQGQSISKDTPKVKQRKRRRKANRNPRGNLFAAAQYFKEKAFNDTRSVYTVSGGLPGLGKRK